MPGLIFYTIYENSKEEEQLAFALKLSRKILKYEVPAYYDTYACILYRLDGIKDAIDWEQKAVYYNDSLNVW